MGVCTHIHLYVPIYRCDNNHAIQNHSYSYLINRHLQQTHNTPHSDTLVYHPTGTYIHTSSSSFTLHLPPSRRDWTSCSLPSAAAISRSLTTEALDAACCDRNSIQTYHYSVGCDGIIYSGTNPQSITMYVLVPNENIAHDSMLGRWTGMHVLFGWGGSAHLAPWTINNYVKFMQHTQGRYLSSGVEELSQLPCTVWYAYTVCRGWRCSYKHHHTYGMFTQQCHSCSSVPHNVKTSELISMQLTSTTGSGTDCSAGTAEYGWMLPGWVSFGSGTWSNSEYIRGGLTWSREESDKLFTKCTTRRTPSAINCIKYSKLKQFKWYRGTCESGSQREQFHQ